MISGAAVFFTAYRMPANVSILGYKATIQLNGVMPAFSRGRPHEAPLRSPVPLCTQGSCRSD